MSQNIDPVQATQLAELEPFDANTLDAWPEARDGNIAISGKATFPNLLVPDGPPGTPPKYRIAISIPKGSDQARLLFAACDHVGKKVWKTEAPQKLANAAFALANGFGGMDGSKVSIYDGDLEEGDWNAGMWVVKAAKNPNDGQPLLYDRVGATDGKAALLGLETPGAADRVAGHNDGVTIILNVWAQKARDRVNLKLLGVIREVIGSASSGPSPEQIAATVERQVVRLPAPASIAGVVPAQAGSQPQPAALQAPRIAAPAATPAPPAAPRVAQPRAAETAVPQGNIFRQPPPVDDGDVDLIDV